MTTVYGSVQNNSWHSALEYYVDSNGYDDVYMLDCSLYGTEINSNLYVIELGDGVDAFGSVKATLSVTGQSSVSKTANGASDNIKSAKPSKVFFIDKEHSAKTITVTGTVVLKNGRLWSGGSSSSISGTSTVTKTLTVPAKTSYSVTYNANGGSGAPSSQTKWYGETLVLSSAKPTRSGWTFVGWAKSATSTSATYQPGGNYTVNSALALYAVWKKTITVNYDANGGSGAPSSQSVTIYNAASSGNITLTTSKPTRSGFKFVGWATSSAGSASYQSGTSYSFSSNTILYAVWSATLTISSLTAIRCDSSGVQNDEGTYTKVVCDWSVDSNVPSADTSITGSIKEDGVSTSTAFSLLPSSGSGSVTSEAIVSGVSIDKQYVVSVSVSATSGGATQTATRSCLLTKAKFTMDWKQGGEGIGIFIAAPSSGLEVGSEAQFDNEVKLKGNYTRIVFEGAVENHSNIVPRIEAYDTNTTTNPRTGMNLVLNSGGNMFLGGGESPNLLYNLASNGATDLPTLSSESPVLSADSYIYLFSNCNTIADRQRMAFGGSAGLLEIPGNLRLVNKTEMPTYYPNARARTDLGYVYGDHVRFRTREYALDNEASSLAAQADSIPIDVTDVDNRQFARFLARQLTNGRVRAAIEAMGHHTGSNVWNSFGVEVRPDGSQHYFATDLANFRADLGISNASNLTSGTVPTARLPNIPIANLPTITVAKGGTGATTAAAARSNLGAAAATWTQVATTTGTTAKTFTALNEAGYKEVLIRAYHSTDYWGTCLLRVADLTTSDREFYLTGGNISASSGRRACCKMQVGKITPINIWIDGTNYSGTWHVFAR